MPDNGFTVSAFPVPETEDEPFNAPAPVRAWADEIMRKSGRWKVDMPDWVEVDWPEGRVSDLAELAKKYRLEWLGPWLNQNGIQFYELVYRPGGEERAQVWAEYIAKSSINLPPPMFDDVRDFPLTIFSNGFRWSLNLVAAGEGPGLLSSGSTRRSRVLDAREARGVQILTMETQPRRFGFVAAAAGGVLIISTAVAIVPLLIKLTINSMRR